MAKNTVQARHQEMRAAYSLGYDRGYHGQECNRGEAAHYPNEYERGWWEGKASAAE